MKQEEKNLLSREKILRAGIREFGEKGYDGASLNVLLSENGLSKGLLYHYYENKDHLYLACVQVCFAMLTEALSAVKTDGSSEEILTSYFETRSLFFREHPNLERIFFDVLLQPPAHLSEQLAAARSDFEFINNTLFQAALDRLKLRDGISREDALQYFALIQSALHLQFDTAAGRLTEAVTGPYEEQVRRTMNLLFYGIVRREER